MDAAQHTEKFIVVFGPPSSFGLFCVSVVHHLLRSTIVNFDHVAASEIDQLQTALDNRLYSNFLLFTDSPDQTIVDNYLRANMPAIAVIEDPVDVIADVILNRSIDAYWAARLAEQSCMTQAEILGAERTLTIARDSRISLESFLVAAAQHLALPLNGHQICQVANAIAPGVIEAKSQTVGSLYESCSPSVAPVGEKSQIFDSSSISSIIERIRNIQSRKIPKIFDWPTQLFIKGDAPNAPFLGKVDLVGPARCVIYGPYLCIPEREWEIEALIRISGNHSGNGLEIDVHQSHVIKRWQLSLPTDGLLKLKGRFTSSDPRSPVQLRFMTTQGAIEGVLSLLSVRMTAVIPGGL